MASAPSRTTGWRWRSSPASAWARSSAWPTGLVGVLRLNPLIVTPRSARSSSAWGLQYSRDVTVGGNVPVALSSWAAEKLLGVAAGLDGAAITIAVTSCGTRLQVVDSRPWARTREPLDGRRPRPDA